MDIRLNGEARFKCGCEHAPSFSKVMTALVAVLITAEIVLVAAAVM